MTPLRDDILKVIAAGEPVAFMSYNHVDNEGEDKRRGTKGDLTRFQEFLSQEMRRLTGIPFPIFQDLKDIGWGQHIRGKFTSSAKRAVFFIPIVTPSYFQSPACCSELTLFLKMEKALGRDDLLLPVYYITCPKMEDEATRDKDALAKILYQRWWLDWRSQRYRNWTNATKRKLAQEAATVGERLSVMIVGAEVAPRRGSKLSWTPAQLNGPLTTAPVAASSPQYVVDAMHRGQFATLSEAVRCADPGSTITVLAGVYQAPITIDKPLNIIGHADSAGRRPTLVSKGRYALQFSAASGRIAGMVISQLQCGDRCAVLIVKGQLLLEDCDITSRGSRCVDISMAAAPCLRNNNIHDCAASGVQVRSVSGTLLEGNTVSRTVGPGIVIARHGNPTLRGNHIIDCDGYGVVIDYGGRGLLENNEVCGNHQGGLFIGGGARAVVRDNTVRDNDGNGVLVCREGRARLEGNKVEGNAVRDRNAPVPRYPRFEGQADGWIVKVLEILFSVRHIGRRRADSGN